MRDRLEELGANTEVVLIMFSDPARLDDYQQSASLPFPILIDESRDTYRRYGLGRASFFRIYGWRAARTYLDIFRSHGVKGFRSPTDDSLQLGGDFVIAPDGNLAWGFWGEGPDDRPTVDAIVSAVRSAG